MDPCASHHSDHRARCVHICECVQVRQRAEHSCRAGHLVVRFDDLVSLTGEMTTTQGGWAGCGALVLVDQVSRSASRIAVLPPSFLPLLVPPVRTLTYVFRSLNTVFLCSLL
jgi:hypothetical protein